MKVVAWLIGVPVALLAIIFAVVNRQVVPVDLWPLPWTVALPLFLLVLSAIGLGMIAGGVVVWISGHKSRTWGRAEHRRANRLDHRVRALETENERLNDAARHMATGAGTGTGAQRALPPA